MLIDPQDIFVHVYQNIQALIVKVTNELHSCCLFVVQTVPSIFQLTTILLFQLTFVGLLLVRMVEHVMLMDPQDIAAHVHLDIQALIVKVTNKLYS